MCPYCGGTGFKAEDAQPMDPIPHGESPDTVRWLNRCSSHTCGGWSVWDPNEEDQQPIPNPGDPESAE